MYSSLSYTAPAFQMVNRQFEIVDHICTYVTTQLKEKFGMRDHLYMYNKQPYQIDLANQNPRGQLKFLVDFI